MANTDAEEKDATEYDDNDDDFNFFIYHCYQFKLKILKLENEIHYDVEQFKCN